MKRPLITRQKSFLITRFWGCAKGREKRVSIREMPLLFACLSLHFTHDFGMRSTKEI